MNPRMTKKDKNVLIGMIRQTFARSDYYKDIMKSHLIEHFDESRPRIKNWSKCQICTCIVPQKDMQLDHIHPVIPLAGFNWDVMTFHDLINRMWCPKEFLQLVCKPCHKVKTKQELQLRVKYRKQLKIAA